MTDRAFQEAHQKLAKARAEIGKVIFGQNSVIDQTLVTLVSGGHLLLIGVPGLAKTLLVDTTAKVLGLDTARVQCTPDLMPADILGSEVLEEGADGKRSFRFIKGPIFTQLLMADEINRASPRTQSALLQAMQEKEVTVSGKAYDVPKPFHVLATQNPIEQEGTYPLPEAQLDRFLMQADVDYPARDAERDMLIATTTNNVRTASAVLKPEELLEIQSLVRDMPIGDSVVDAILTLVRRGRPDSGASDIVKDYVAWAPGPRAAQALMLAVRASALIDGREAPSVDDVIDLAEPVLKHRMALNYKARGSGITLQNVIRGLSESL
ncbi:MAG TPA: MoxR family ATPase [Alphaproteobacteria bacterium]|nr:MoxR family ATPase [Alphaproteobacteria bacterium]